MRRIFLEDTFSNVTPFLESVLSQEFNHIDPDLIFAMKTCTANKMPKGKTQWFYIKGQKSLLDLVMAANQGSLVKFNLLFAELKIAF